MHQKLEIDSQGKYGLGAKSYFQDISGTDLMKPKLQVIFYFGSMAKTYGHFLTYKIHLKKNETYGCSKYFFSFKIEGLEVAAIPLSPIIK